MSVRYDVVVAGAGAAGGLAAYFLARRGARVLVVEKKRLPRYKPCGGGLTRRALRQLPFDVTELIEDYSFTGRVLLDNRTIYCATESEPIVNMVMRDRLDHFLVGKAVEAGAELWEEASLLEISGDPEALMVKTSKGAVATRYLAGADGVNGRSVRLLGLKVEREVMQALEAEVYYPNTDTADRYRGEVHFDFGVIDRGYGWVFPKKDHLSIGIGTYSKDLKNLRGIFGRYLRGKGLESGAEIERIRPHLIPVRPAAGNRTANHLGLVIGDAAGFTDPVTGEGLYYALSGAGIAADTIFEALQHGPAGMTAYHRRLSERFRDLKYAAPLSRAFYEHPRLSGRALKKYGERLGRHMFDVVSGRQSYFQLYRRMFDPKWLLGLALSDRKL